MDNNKTDDFSIDDLLSSRLINSGNETPPVVEEEDIFSLNTDEPLFSNDEPLGNTGVSAPMETGNRFEVTPPVLDRSEEVKQLEAKLEALRRENDGLKVNAVSSAASEELKALKRENENLKSSLQSSEKESVELEELKKENQGLKDIINNQSSGGSKLEAQIMSLEKQNKFLQQENTDLLTDKVEMENRLKKAETDTEGFKAEAETQKQVALEKAEEVKGLKERKEALNKDLEDARNKIADTEEKINRKDDEINRIAEDFSKKEAELFEEISTLDNRIKQSENDFSAKLEDMQRQLETLRLDNETLGGDLEKQKDENSVLSNDMRGLELRIEAVRSDKELLEITNGDLKNRIDARKELLMKISEFFSRTGEDIVKLNSSDESSSETKSDEEDILEDIQIQVEAD